MDEERAVWVKLLVGADRRVIKLAVEAARQQEIPFRLKEQASVFRALSRAMPALHMQRGLKT